MQHQQQFQQPLQNYQPPSNQQQPQQHITQPPPNQQQHTQQQQQQQHPGSIDHQLGMQHQGSIGQQLGMNNGMQAGLASMAPNHGIVQSLGMQQGTFPSMPHKVVHSFTRSVCSSQVEINKRCPLKVVSEEDKTR